MSTTQHQDTATHPWTQENQPGERGALYAKILRDYRRDRERFTRHRERAQRLHHHATRLAATFNPLRTTPHK